MSERKILGFFSRFQDEVRQFQQEAQIMSQTRTLSHRVRRKEVTADEASEIISKTYKDNQESLEIAHSYLDGFMDPEAIFKE